MTSHEVRLVLVAMVALAVGFNLGRLCGRRWLPDLYVEPIRKSSTFPGVPRWWPLVWRAEWRWLNGRGYGWGATPLDAAWRGLGDLRQTMNTYEEAWDLPGG